MLPGDGAALYRFNTHRNSRGRQEAGHVTDVLDKGKKAGSMMQYQLPISQLTLSKLNQKKDSLTVKKL